MHSKTGLVANARWTMRCPGYYLLRLVAAPNSRQELAYHRRRSVRSLSELLGKSEGEVVSTITEARTDARLIELRRQLLSLPYSGPFRAGPQLFAMIRLFRPDSVVETGVGVGYSTTLILEALHLNGKGRLRSIDLPNNDVNWKLPNGRQPGYLVPQELRDRWELSIGSSRQLLPGLLDKIGPIQLFLHDSEHSYENMLFEYRAVYPSLSARGIILSDDAMWNTAMLDFAHQIRQPIKFIYHDGGSAPVTAIKRPG